MRLSIAQSRPIPLQQTITVGYVGPQIAFNRSIAPYPSATLTIALLVVCTLVFQSLNRALSLCNCLEFQIGDLYWNYFQSLNRALSLCNKVLSTDGRVSRELSIAQSRPIPLQLPLDTHPTCISFGFQSLNRALSLCNSIVTQPRSLFCDFQSLNRALSLCNTRIRWCIHLKSSFFQSLNRALSLCNFCATP